MWKFWEPKIVYVEVPSVCDHDESQLSSLLAAKLGDINSVEITDDGTKEIFAQLARVDGFLDFLRDTMANDVKRYFAAQTEKEREIIRGGFSRTSYLRALLLDTTK